MRARWLAGYLVTSLVALHACSPPDAHESVAVNEMQTYRSEAEAGDADAQFTLAVLYLSGLGTGGPEDMAEAANWFRRAAEQGHVAAQSKLGEMYAAGKGVQQSDRDAVNWYRRAAEQGSADAQFELAAMYSDGTGVLQNHLDAANWYRRAAQKGHAGAMSMLALKYTRGEGVQKDYVRAHMWIDLAAEAGDGPTAVLQRVTISGEMTPSQIAEAQRLARECLASNYQRCGEQGEVRTTPLARSRR
jgi:TPR repeat protein